MKYFSSQLLDDLYQQTEKNISKAISEWQRIPGYQMTTQPGPGKWSASQCLEHLNSYGRFYLPAMEKAIHKSGCPKATFHFKSGWLGNYFYKIMLPENNGRPKKKMRSPKDHQPSLALNSGEVLNEFISQLELLGRLLTDARDIDINNARVPISISPFIKLKLGNTFLFFIAHINRHILQAERALKNAGTRSASVAGREHAHSM